MNKILVTGATGFVGRYVINWLKEFNFEVVGTYYSTNLSSAKINSDIHFEKMDIFDEASCKNVLSKVKPTHMMHLAWAVPPREFWHSLENVNWLYASIKLFTNFCSQGGKHFIGAGTLAEYDWNYEVLDEETTPLNPHTLYGETKKSLYAIINTIKKFSFPDIKLSWARIGNFFGEEEPKDKLFSTLNRKIKNDEVITLLDKDLARDYAHVNHLAKTLARMAKLDEDTVINVGGGKLVKIIDVVDHIGKCFNKKPSIKFNISIAQTTEPTTLCPNVTRMKKLLGEDYSNDFWNDLENFIRAVNG
jgi:nucleoside-diphosphate-sugar epimerase